MLTNDQRKTFLSFLEIKNTDDKWLITINDNNWLVTPDQIPIDCNTGDCAEHNKRLVDPLILEWMQEATGKKVDDVNNPFADAVSYGKDNDDDEDDWEHPVCYDDDDDEDDNSTCPIKDLPDVGDCDDNRIKIQIGQAELFLEKRINEPCSGIIDWRGVVDREGKPLPFSAENLKQFFEDPHMLRRLEQVTDRGEANQVLTQTGWTSVSND